MRNFIQWIGSKGAWTRSEFSDLPALNPEVSASRDHWRVVAGGLALILSRASSTELATRFKSSAELYLLLRRSLEQGRRPDAGAHLVGDVMHEIEATADPMTKESVRACFNACVRHQRKGSTPSQPPSRSIFEGMTSTQWRAASSQCTESVDQDDIPTQVCADVFVERSVNLRKTLATARTTGFAELK